MCPQIFCFRLKDFNWYKNSFKKEMMKPKFMRLWNLKLKQN